MRDSNMLKTPYYIFDADSFVQNYRELEKAFSSVYSKYRIGYSFKTNYTPAVCEIVKSLGGYAEVVSDMEYMLAKKIGFPDQRIIYNGPGKGVLIESCLIGHGMLNVDHLTELDTVCEIAEKYSNQDLEIGLRVNFDIDNGLHSRFGIDVTNGDIEKAIDKVGKNPNLHIAGLHFHISRARGLDAWKRRISTILDIADRYFDGKLKYVDIGSGMFGHLDEALQSQFGSTPSYEEYAAIVAGTMHERYKDTPEELKPLLITEPGTTIVSKYFTLKATVLDIKEIRGKSFALLDCSFQNAGEICGLKKIPMHIYHSGESSQMYENLDFVGYTCLEQDVIYKGYGGKLEKGDVVEFGNVGGYSIVEKPPFIHPDIPIFMDCNGKMSCIKRAQTFEDIFAPYCFECVEGI